MNLLESLPKEKLTREQEFALAAKIQKDPKEDLINELVLRTMTEGFVYTKGVCRGKIADDELFSLVYKTLYRNAKRFRPGGIRFHAFAKAGLRGALSRYWSGLNTVRNADEMVAIIDSSVDDQRRLRRDRAFRGHDGEFNGQRFRQHTPTQEPEYPAMHLRERLGFINAAMTRKLSAQERMIITLVYTSGFNFQEVGDLLGITRSAVQSMHTESLKKIRQELGRKRLLSE